MFTVFLRFFFDSRKIRPTVALQEPCYAVSNVRIVLGFRIDGHEMGQEIEVEGEPHIAVDVKGAGTIDEVAVVRDGAIARSIHPGKDAAHLDYVDDSFSANSYYYVRVTQTDTDDSGNPSSAWSSPIWLKPQR